MELSSNYVATPSSTLEFEYCESEKVRAHVELSPVLELRSIINMTSIDVCPSFCIFYFASLKVTTRFRILKNYVGFSQQDSSYTRGSVHPNETSFLPTVQQMSFDHGGMDLSGQVSEVSLKPINIEESLVCLLCFRFYHKLTVIIFHFIFNVWFCF